MERRCQRRRAAGSELGIDTDASHPNQSTSPGLARIESPPMTWSVALTHICCTRLCRPLPPVPAAAAAASSTAGGLGAANTKQRPQRPPLPCSSRSFPKRLERKRERPHWIISLAGLVFCAAAVVDEVSFAGGTGSLLGSSNGRWVSFFKSVHGTNYYWYKSRYASRSVFGALILKFAGSTLVSLALGKRTIWVASPRHVVSFLLAFSLVRSDSWEARELSGHMRHVPFIQMALNLVAALYELRKMIFVVEQGLTGELGVGYTFLVGVAAFSAANLIMSCEGAAIRTARRCWPTDEGSPATPLRPRAGLGSPPHQSAPEQVAQADVASAPAVAALTPARDAPEAVSAIELPTRYPKMGDTLSRISFYFIVLLGGHLHSEALYSAGKVLVLGLLAWHYNLGLIEMMASSGALDGNGQPTQPSSFRLPPSSGARKAGVGMFCFLAGWRAARPKAMPPLSPRLSAASVSPLVAAELPPAPPPTKPLPGLAQASLLCAQAQGAATEGREQPAATLVRAPSSLLGDDKCKDD